MKAKEYLQQLQRLDTVINQKIKELGDLRLKSRSVGALTIQKSVCKQALPGMLRL